MEREKPDWQTVYKGHPINIWKRSVGGTEVYYISSSSKKKPLVITKAEKSNGKLFWTSVPEGMQQVAEEIGAIIEQMEK